MGQISLQIPQVGQPDSTEDPKVASDLTTIQTVINGNLDATNLSATLAQSATVNQAAQTVKGAVNIAGSQSTTSTAYTTLATPDQVTGIVLPANGLLVVGYKALMSVAGTDIGFVGLFLNGVQVTTGGSGAPAAVESSVDGSTNLGHVVSDSSRGLVAMANTGTASSDVTTGQLVGAYVSGGGVGSGLAPGGGLAVMFASAGTYTVSVRYRVSVNTTTVAAQNRHLWVQALSFA